MPDVASSKLPAFNVIRVPDAGAAKVNGDAIEKLPATTTLAPFRVVAPVPLEIK